MARALVGGRGLYIEDLETKEALLELEKSKRHDVLLKAILLLVGRRWILPFVFCVILFVVTLLMLWH
jgi:hypothetical protein